MCVILHFNLIKGRSQHAVVIFWCLHLCLLFSVLESWRADVCVVLSRSGLYYAHQLNCNLIKTTTTPRRRSDKIHNGDASYKIRLHLGALLSIAICWWWRTDTALNLSRCKESSLLNTTDIHFTSPWLASCFTWCSSWWSSICWLWWAPPSIAPTSTFVSHRGN